MLSNTLSGQVEFESGLSIGPTPSDTVTAGTMRWNATAERFEGYNGTRWVPFGGVGSLWGRPQANRENSKPVTNTISVDRSTISIGQAIGISDDIMAVGCPGAEGSGRVLTYSSVDSKPFEGPVIIPPGNAVPNGRFGAAIDVRDDLMLVGAPDANRAYLYEKSINVWNFVTELTVPDTTFTGGDLYGFALAITADRAYVAAPFRGNGRIYLFERNGSNWTYTQMITDPNASTTDEFASSIDASGSLLIAGAPRRGGGEVITFRPGLFGIWGVDERLKPSDFDVSQDFGKQVVLDGNLILASAPEDGVSQGAVYVFSSFFTSWLQTQKLTLPSPQNFDGFGKSIAAHNGTLVVGSDFQATAEGNVFVYNLDTNENKFVYQANLISSQGNAGRYGETVAVFNNVIAVGSPGLPDDSGFVDVGAFFIYIK